ncbi:GlcG/HbpS family heme-binding protein [Massilia brevitalea]|uniref:GlcG/HbpS family heme-binding protein n=1 Tax=Massilia brevitalea TaxID=442526 RepID=UPI00273A4234|nr:heme-binding protein [Massilia brevitalea]
MTRLPAALLTISLAATALPAAAQLRQQPDLTLAAANRLASGAIEACRRQGRDIVVAVLDRGGNLVALQRADTVGPHNTEAARRKAYTALSTRSSTFELARKAAAPDARNLATLPELLLLGGGLPLLAQGQPVGAIGVAGGGGAVNDDACARAAIAAVPELD